MDAADLVKGVQVEAKDVEIGGADRSIRHLVIRRTGRTAKGRQVTDAMTESGLKQAVLRMAYANGWAVYHVPQATMHNGGGRGYPDLTLARDKECLWIELKAQDGKVSPAQEGWLQALPAAHVIRPSDWHSGRVAELLA